MELKLGGGVEEEEGGREGGESGVVPGDKPATPGLDLFATSAPY